ncbi:MAG: MoaD/ThiS family protein [Streptosporangiaceae bacterium]|nr:MoaD/ThiS family protein [Streptosporangiaceae bacterium]
MSGRHDEQDRPPGEAANGGIRVVLPAHLKNLARVRGEVTLRLGGGHDTMTRQALLDALEAAYPVLRGTIRDRATGRRRAFIRFYACQRDLSNEPPDVPLPAAVTSGAEPFLVVGAMAGG